MRERITSEKSWRLQQSSRQMQDNFKSHSQDIRNFLCISLSIHSFNCNAMESKSRSYFFSWEGGLRPINLFIKCINASYLKGLINTRGVWFFVLWQLPWLPCDVCRGWRWRETRSSSTCCRVGGRSPARPPAVASS